MAELAAIIKNMDDIEKAKAFDKIADMFYRKNFGSASKTDIETLMFSIYMNAMIDENCTNGVLDYPVCSDYKLGKELGITPQKISGLKVRAELKYPREDFNWKSSLRNIITTPGNVHSSGGMIQITIPDPNLFLAVREYIEDNRGIVDIRLNSKLLCVSQADLITLVYSFADENEKKEIIRLVNMGLKEEGKRQFTGGGLSEFREGVGAVTDVLGLISALGDMTNPVSAVFRVACTVLNAAGRIM